MAEEGPIILPIETGVLRLIQPMGIEREPALIGILFAAGFGFLVLSGQWQALYGLIFCAMWWGIWYLAAQRDPQYWQIMWQKERYDRWPAVLYPAPGVLAPLVKITASCPVRADAGAFDE